MFLAGNRGKGLNNSEMRHRNLRYRIISDTLIALAQRARPAAFATLSPAVAVVVSGDPFFDSQRDRLVELSTRYRVPAIYQWKEFAEIGGLISYGTNITNAYFQAGVYTARILMPIKFYQVINLKTAKALDITIAPSLIATADGVIE
jgi:putative tryptophan/tyrosine transport system substrate-binding protein